MHLVERLSYRRGVTTTQSSLDLKTEKQRSGRDGPHGKEKEMNHITNKILQQNSRGSREDIVEVLDRRATAEGRTTGLELVEQVHVSALIVSQRLPGSNAIIVWEARGRDEKREQTPKGCMDSATVDHVHEKKRTGNINISACGVRIVCVRPVVSWPLILCIRESRPNVGSEISM